MTAKHRFRARVGAALLIVLLLTLSGLIDGSIGVLIALGLVIATSALSMPGRVPDAKQPEIPRGVPRTVPEPNLPPTLSPRVAHVGPGTPGTPGTLTCGSCGNVWRTKAKGGQSIRCPTCGHKRRVPVNPTTSVPPMDRYTAGS